MELDVTVQIGDEDVPAGRLYLSVRRGVETATFSYAPSYLADPRSFSFGPDMPLGPGTFHLEGCASSVRSRTACPTAGAATS